MIYLTTPLKKSDVAALKAGDEVALSGVIYTARDAAHLRMIEALASGRALPFEPEGQVIYYSGASPTKPGDVIGACGPTTSYRMDKMTPALLKRGVLGMIGKGDRSPEVIDSIVENGAVYFAAIGGAGALIASTVVSSEVIAYEDLGTEAVRKLEVKDFKVTVVIDAEGNNLYKTEAERYRTL